MRGRRNQRSRILSLGAQAFGVVLGLLLVQNCGNSTPPFNGDAGTDATLDGPSSGVQITTTTLPDAMAGAPYQARVAAIGGSFPYTWSITSGPSWLTIVAATGVLGGTPAVTDAGPVSLTVQVVDSLQQMDTHSYQFTVTKCNPGQTVACFTGDLPDAGSGTCNQGTATCNSDGSLGTCSATGPSNDPAHCDGTCMACGSAGDKCTNGQCTCGSQGECAPGSACCSGTCLSVGFDPQHCGDCTTNCTTNTPTGSVAACTAGSCDYTQCLPGYADCDGVPGCECGPSDPSINHATGTCQNGVCKLVCDPGWGDCGSGYCDTSLSSPTTCGSCTAFPDGGGGGNCPKDPNGLGQATCTVNPPNSQPPATCGLKCNPGYQECNGACVSLQDPANCGLCGHNCATNAPVNTTAGCSLDTSVNAYVCTYTCAPGTQECNGQCISQPNNNACGLNCEVCTQGSTCTNTATGYACTGQTSGFSCGSTIGSTCGGASQTYCCTTTPSTCCEPTGQNQGTCADRVTDVANCGPCGHKCGTTNTASVACTNAHCALVCTTNYFNCDKLADGTPNDANGCEQQCNATHAAPTCDQGRCYEHCAFGYGDCLDTKITNTQYANHPGDYTNGCTSQFGPTAGESCSSPTPATINATSGTPLHINPRSIPFFSPTDTNTSTATLYPGHDIWYSVPTTQTDPLNLAHFIVHIHANAHTSWGVDVFNGCGGSQVATTMTSTGGSADAVYNWSVNACTSRMTCLDSQCLHCTYVPTPNGPPVPVCTSCPDDTFLVHIKYLGGDLTDLSNCDNGTWVQMESGTDTWQGVQ